MAIRTTKRWVAGYPELVAQWHEQRNVDLYPYEVTHASAVPVWWKCSAGPDHEWHASPAHRADKRGVQGCPFCAGKRVSATNSLETLAPQTAAEWHPQRNGSLRPADVTAGTWRKAWWRCSRGHVWEAAVVKRVRDGTACPKCSGNVVSTLNALSTRFPKLAAEWHPTKNGELGPDDVSYGSKKRVWWTCPNDSRHVYVAPPNRRTANGAGCPYCSGNQLEPTKSLAALHPAVAAEWHPTRNGKTGAAGVSRASQVRVWWKCAVNARHVWPARVCDRTSMGLGCPKCARSKVGARGSLPIA